MNKINKKIKKVFSIGLVILAIFLLLPNYADAAVFNNNSLDKPTLRASNYTDYPNSSSNWTSSVFADAGEVVSFVIYYHNNSSETAYQTRLRLNIPAYSFTNASAIADVWANNAAVVVGAASVNLSSNQNLVYIPGSARWYPDKSAVAQAFPGGQTGDEVATGSGINIGDIGAGWATSGYITLRAQVSNNTTGSAPVVNTSPATNISSNSLTLNGTVNPNGYNTTAWFEYGPTTSLGYSASSQSMGSGNTTLNYSTGITGLSSNTTYYYRSVAQNTYGTTYGSLNSIATNSTSSFGSAPVTTTNFASNISANSMNLTGFVNPNGSNTNAWFEWGTSMSLGNLTSSQSMGSGSSSLNFSYILNGLNANTTYYYRAVAQNNYGTSYGSTMSLTTSSTSTSASAPTITTSPATNISSNSLTLNGTVNPNGYNTTAWFEYGPTTSLGYSASSQSMGSGNTTLNYSTGITGLSSNTTYYYRSVAQNTYGTTYGSLNSIATNSTSSFGSAPTITTNVATNITTSFLTLNSSINANNAVTETWFEYGTTLSLGYSTPRQAIGSGSGILNYAYTITGLSSNTTYYYRAVASNSYGIVYGGVTSAATQAVITTTSGIAPTVSTGVTLSDSSDSLVLKGIIDPKGSATKVWFEWGLSNSLGNSTYQQAVLNLYTSSNFSHTLKGLSANTIFYYRAVASNPYGRVYGDVLSVATQNLIQNSSVKTVSVSAPAAVKSDQSVASKSISQLAQDQFSITTDSSVAFGVNVDKTEVAPGESFVYTVFYQNIDFADVSDAVIKIDFPSGVEYRGIQSQKPDLDKPIIENNSLIFKVGKINVDGEGNIKIKFEASKTASDNNLLFVATMDYKDDAGKAHSINVFQTVNLNKNKLSGLEASLVYGIRSFSDNWLLIFIILGLVYGGYRIAKIGIKKINEKRASV